MSTITTISLFAFLIAGCSNAPMGEPDLGTEDMARGDLASTNDLSGQPDLARQADMAGMADMAVAGDMATGPLTVGGVIYGLTGTLQLTESNTGATQLISAPGPYSFVVAAGSYGISISLPPSDVENCTVENATGTAPSGNVNIYCVHLPQSVYLGLGVGGAWNEYARSDGTGDCGGKGSFYCVHAAEHLEVALPGIASCAGLSAADALGAFDWSCDDASGTARFLSSESKLPLSSLLDFDLVAFRDNQVTVSGGPAALATPSGVWWSNPIATLNTGGLASSSGTIYLKTDAAPMNTAILNDEGIAFVVRPSVTVTATSLATSFVSSATTRFAWIEGAFDGTGGTALQDGISISASYSVIDHASMKNLPAQSYPFGRAFSNYGSHSVMRHLTVDGAMQGVSLGFGLTAADNTLIDATLANVSWGLVVGGTLNHVRDVRISSFNASPYGGINMALNLAYPTNSIFSNILAATGNASFVYSSSADIDGNVFANLAMQGSSTGPTTTGFDVEAGAHGGNTFLGLTLTGFPSGQPAFYSSSSTWPSTAVALLVTHNFGLGMGSTGDVVYDGLATTYNGTLGFATSASTVASQDTVLIGQNTGGQCEFSYTTTPTFSCAPFSTVSSTVGGGSYFSSAAPFGLALNDSGAVNVLLSRNPLPSASATFAHVWHSNTPPASSDDCLSFAGSQFSTVGGGHCETQAVLYAVELLGDGIGNDNLLCESGETCLVMPNLGAYQGHGSLVAAGSLSGGALTSPVTLVKYSVNGY